MSKVPVRRFTRCAMREQRFPPCQTVSVTSLTTPIHSKRVCPLKGSNPHVKTSTPAPNPLRHARKTFPTRQTCPTTLPTTPMHSKTLIPPKDSNPHAKTPSSTPNPLRHAPIPLPGTLHNPNHFPHCPHKQQKTPHPSGIEPAS